MALVAKDHLKEVVGLKNDIVNKVFTCPECKADVTISRYQVAGELSIMCARCNARWQIKGEELLDLNQKEREFMGYTVFLKLTETQKNPPKPAAAAPKPAVAGPGPAAKPASAPSAGVGAAPKAAVPVAPEATAEGQA